MPRETRSTNRDVTPALVGVAAFLTVVNACVYAYTSCSVQQPANAIDSVGVAVSISKAPPSLSPRLSLPAATPGVKSPVFPTIVVRKSVSPEGAMGSSPVSQPVPTSQTPVSEAENSPSSEPAGSQANDASRQFPRRRMGSNQGPSGAGGDGQMDQGDPGPGFGDGGPPPGGPGGGGPEGGGPPPGPPPDGG